MQNFRTLGLRIKKVRDLFILSDEYGKIIRCVTADVIICRHGYGETANSFSSSTRERNIPAPPTTTRDISGQPCQGQGQNNTHHCTVLYVY